MRKILKTEWQLKKEKLYKDIYADWVKLTKNPENRKDAVTAYIMNKYGVCRNTVYNVRWRFENR